MDLSAVESCHVSSHPSVSHTTGLKFLSHRVRLPANQIYTAGAPPDIFSLRGSSSLITGK